MKEIVIKLNVPHWTIEEETGYKPFTTFWQDFSMADQYGAKAIRDTYKRAFDEWKGKYKYLTELVLVLNHKIWQHYKPAPALRKFTMNFGAKPTFMPAKTSRAKNSVTIIKQQTNMAHASGMNRNMAELMYNVHEGDTIRITKLDDPYDDTYVGREGVVEHIDSLGQLHGTWGGLAVLCGIDGFEVIKHTMNVYKVFVEGTETPIIVFSPSELKARAQATRNLGEGVRLSRVEFKRKATEEEIEEINSTGAPCPNRRKQK